MNAAIENLNIANDSRSQSAPKTTIWNDDGSEEQLPVKIIVCPACTGRGSYVNPAIDAGGLSTEMLDDADFHEQYAAGVYDMTCQCCNGRTTVKAVDLDRLTEEQEAQYRSELDAEAESRAEQLAEIAMGC